MKKLVIFDLDGTLLNTINDLGISCNFALETLGYNTHPLSAYPFMVGNGVRKLVERAQPEASPSQVDRLVEVFKEHYDLHNTDTSQIYPGMSELLAELQDKGLALAVASNKYQKAVTKMIGHFFPDIKFVSVQGQVEGRKVKPDPSVVFSILQDFPVKKDEVLYVGDSSVDIETARRACVESVGVTWGFAPVSQLRKACADHIVSAPAEIINFL